MSSRVTKGGFGSELLFVLVPLVLAFATSGLPGFRLGPTVIKLNQVILIIAMPFLLFLRSPGWMSRARRCAPVAVFAVSLALAVLCTVFVKRFPLIEVRDTKNIVLPMAFLAAMLLKYFTTMDRVQRGMNAIAIGIAASCIGVYTKLGDAVLGIRSIRNTEFYETAGVSYVWLGVGGAVVVGIATWRLWARPPVSGLLLWGALAAFGAGAVLVSGTRAAMLALVVSPVLIWLVPRVSTRVWRIAVPAFIAVVFVVSVWPSLFIEFAGAPRYLTQGGVEGSERFVSSRGYADDLGSRLWWWRLMQADYTPVEQVLGFDYQTALTRVGDLGHPHNVFVWARIMGGFPAALLLAVSLVGLIAVPIRRMRDRATKPLAALNLFLYVLIVPALLTNSWPGGNYSIFVVALAVTAFLHGAPNEEP